MSDIVCCGSWFILSIKKNYPWIIAVVAVKCFEMVYKMFCLLTVTKRTYLSHTHTHSFALPFFIRHNLFIFSKNLTSQLTVEKIQSNVNIMNIYYKGLFVYNNYIMYFPKKYCFLTEHIHLNLNLYFRCIRAWL